MAGFSITISLKTDEREAIQRFMEEHSLKRHEVIKLAIRKFFFPTETTIPLNGREAHMTVEPAAQEERPEIEIKESRVEFPKSEMVEIRETESEGG
jgi:hypothetical protein